MNENEKQKERIAQLKKELKELEEQVEKIRGEKVELWVKKDNEIEQLEAKLKTAESTPHKYNSTSFNQGFEKGKLAERKKTIEKWDSCMDDATSCGKALGEFAQWLKSQLSKEGSKKELKNDDRY